MSKKKTIDQLADEIIRDFDAGDTPEAQARAALQQAADAGGGGLRQQYLQTAQAHIARLDPRRNAKLVQELQANVLALQGRGGDTRIAHLTNGELVIPAQMLTPDFMQALAAEARARGIDPRSLFVGSRQNAVNPRTGLMEFGDDDSDDSGDGSQISSSNSSDLTSNDITEIPVTAQPMTGVMPRDVDALARMMVSESTNETTPGLYQALGSVALNRVGNRNINGGNQTIQDIVKNRSQFQGYGKPNWVNAEKQPGYSRALEVANGLLSGTLGDNTGGAVMFYSRANDSDNPPGEFAARQQAPVGSWRRLEPTAQFHPFTFLNQPWG